MDRQADDRRPDANAHTTRSARGARRPGSPHHGIAAWSESLLRTFAEARGSPTCWWVTRRARSLTDPKAATFDVRSGRRSSSCGGGSAASSLANDATRPPNPGQPAGCRRGGAGAPRLCSWARRASTRNSPRSRSRRARCSRPVGAIPTYASRDRQIAGSLRSGGARQRGLPWISAMPGLATSVKPSAPASSRRYDEAKARWRANVTNWGAGTPTGLLRVDDLASACLYLLEHFDGRPMST